jgi:signal transduction histidine kinase
MPVRLKITLLFTLLTVLLLTLVSGTVYYISYTNREANIKTRLTNRAITTARLLSRAAFERNVIERIDSLTATALKNKTVQAYNATDRRIYSFSDSYTDTVEVSNDILARTRKNKTTYFTRGIQDVVAYHYEGAGYNIVIISGAYDELGVKNLSQLAWILLFSSIGGIVIAFFSGYVFSARLLSPVTRIADQVNEISAQNLTNRIPTSKIKDEWNYLAETLNSLLNRLQESFETQRRFISNASHELSTPLTSISSQLQVYLQKERDVQEYRKVMESINQDVQHMSRLTKTLLEFAKASGNTGGLELNVLRIDEILLRLPAELQKLNQGYSVSLLFLDLPEDEKGLMVYGNEDLLFTAIKNIVLNACKYSADNKAEVILSVKQDSIFIEIKDKGKGISETDIKKIFEPFYRINEARSTEGFGLGLSLALNIIRLHRGNIDVASIPNRGSDFIITLPLALNRFDRD